MLHGSGSMVHGRANYFSQMSTIAELRIIMCGKSHVRGKGLFYSGKLLGGVKDMGSKEFVVFEFSLDLHRLS